MPKKTIATVTVVFESDTVISDFEVHERLQELIEQDAVPIEYTTEEVADTEPMKTEWDSPEEMLNDFFPHPDKSKEDDDPLAYALCCSECKSDDIEFQVWADEHDVVQSGGRESGKCYCNKCEDETTCEIKKG